MLRYKTETRPRLVALYDIRLRNGAGLFLQPYNPTARTGPKSCGRIHQNVPRTFLSYPAEAQRMNKNYQLHKHNRRQQWVRNDHKVKRSSTSLSAANCFWYRLCLTCCRSISLTSASVSDISMSSSSSSDDDVSLSRTFLHTHTHITT